MDLLPPVRLSIARLPTPLEPLGRVEEAQDLELWVKRDDLTGAALSGNKVRKLDFLVADALAHGADTLVTCGAVTSNHARATALCAARAGLRAHLLLRGADEVPPRGNLLLDRIAGAAVDFVDEAGWAERDARMASIARRLEGEGRRAYVIPEGGSSALGSMGYAVAAEELLAQAGDLGLSLGTVVVPVGSGGTLAGLALGLAAHGREDVDLVGMAVCNDTAYFEAIVARILEDAVRAGFASADVAARARYRVLDAYRGAGYARFGPADVARIRRVARAEGLVLDPVYTNKAFAGLGAEARAGRLGRAGATVFVHTGGLFGLLQLADAVAREDGAEETWS